MACRLRRHVTDLPCERAQNILRLLAACSEPPHLALVTE